MNVRTDSTRRRTDRATPRTWWGLIVLLLPAVLVSMDISILFVASPAITAVLAPSGTQWLWMMDVYSFVLAGLLVTMGGLADRIGRRRLLLIGAGAFGLASLALAYASSPEMFIAGRALLGIGAATLAPSTLALIRGMFIDESQRRTAVAAWTVAFTGGAVAGPVLGGLLLEHFWWGSVFGINLPVMVVLLIAAPLIVPESRNPAAARFDIPGAALSLTGIVAVVFAAKRFAAEQPDTVAVAAGILGGGLLWLFVRRQRRIAEPLLELSLFRRPAFSAAVLANALAALAMVGLGLLAFTYLQTVHGLSPLLAAVTALPTLVGTLAGAVLASALARRLPPALLVPAGLVIAAAGMGGIAVTDHGGSVLPFIAWYTVLTFGVGVVSTLANSLILTTAPPERAGAAASVSETGMVLGDALGIAAFGTVSAAVFRARMRDSEIGRLHSEATETVGGAITVAERLPAAEHARLLTEAFSAFSSGLTAVAALGAVVLALTAVLTAVGLRRVPVPAQPAEQG